MPVEALHVRQRIEQSLSGIGHISTQEAHLSHMKPTMQKPIDSLSKVLLLAHV